MRAIEGLAFMYMKPPGYEAMVAREAEEEARRKAEEEEAKKRAEKQEEVQKLREQASTRGGGGGGLCSRCRPNSVPLLLQMFSGTAPGSVLENMLQAQREAEAAAARPQGMPIGEEQARTLLDLQQRRWVMKYGPGGRSPPRQGRAELARGTLAAADGSSLRVLRRISVQGGCGPGSCQPAVPGGHGGRAACGSRGGRPAGRHIPAGYRWQWRRASCVPSP